MSLHIESLHTPWQRMFIDAMHADFGTVYAPRWNGYFGSPSHANIRVETPSKPADIAVFDGEPDELPDAKRRVYIIHLETPPFSCSHTAAIRKVFKWATDVVWVSDHKRATFESVLRFANAHSGFDGPLPRFHTIPFWIPIGPVSNPKTGLVGTIHNNMVDQHYDFWNTCTDGLQDLLVVGINNDKANGVKVSPYGRQEYVSVIPQIDVFLHVVVGNSFGISPLEAMACGIPVVASTNRDIPVEFIDGVNILMCHNRGMAAVEEARHHIQRVLSDRKLRHQVGDAGRETVRALYSLERFQSAFRNVLFQ
jgi:hypothetical protein